MALLASKIGFCCRLELDDDQKVQNNKYDLNNPNYGYDRRYNFGTHIEGCGGINEKSIRINRLKQSNCYLLAEVQTQKAA